MSEAETALLESEQRRSLALLPRVDLSVISGSVSAQSDDPALIPVSDFAPLCSAVRRSAGGQVSRQSQTGDATGPIGPVRERYGSAVPLGDLPGDK